VLDWGNPHPWLMRGFPGKIRHLAWSNSLSSNTPLLAASSVEGVVVWTKGKDDREGWNARVLDLHNGIVRGLAFQPNSLLLASAGDDGCLYLWEKAKRVGQIFNGAEGFSCLAWHPSGEQLAAGGQQGELLVWQKYSKNLPKGFRGKI
jgi:WD40 repeat protein